MFKRIACVLLLLVVAAMAVHPVAGQEPESAPEPAVLPAEPAPSPVEGTSLARPIHDLWSWQDPLDDVWGLSNTERTTDLNGEVILSQLFVRANTGNAVLSMVRGTAPDNKIYMGTANCRLLVFDPATGLLQDKGKPVPDEPDWGWNGITGLVNIGGKIYGGTSGLGHMFIYTPTTSTSQDLGKPFAGDYGIYALATTGGKIFGGTGGGPGEGQLFVYNPTTRVTERQFTAVAGEWAVLSLVVGTDGKLYGGTGHTCYCGFDGHLFVYNPATPAVAPLDKGNSMEGGSISSLIVGPGNLIYGGTWEGGNLFSYNPATGAIQNRGQPRGGAAIPKLVKGNDNLIYGGSAEWHSHFWSYNPTTLAYADLGMVQWNEGQTSALLTPLTDGIMYGCTWGQTNVLYSWDPGAGKHPYRQPGSATSVDIVPAMSERWQPKGCNRDIEALTQGPHGLIYFGHGCNQLRSYNPETGEVKDLGGTGVGDLVALTAGHDGRIYGGTCCDAYLVAYDPKSQSFVDLGQPVPDEQDIRALVTGRDGKIYGGTSSRYQGSYGHLIVYDPATGTSSDLGVAVDGEERIETLTVGLDGKIYGGTSGWGPVRHGHLFVYDPGTGMFTDLGYPVTADDQVVSLATAPDGTIWGGTCCGNGHLFRYNPASGAFSDKGRAQPVEWVVWALTVAPDGMVYVGTGDNVGRLLRYDPLSGIFTRLGDPIGDDQRITSLLMHDSGLVYGGTGWQNGYLFSYDPHIAFTWGKLDYAATVPPSTTLTVDVLDMAGNVLLSHVAPGDPVAIDPIRFPALRLKARLATTNGNVTPRLSQWALGWNSVAPPAVLRFPEGLVFCHGGSCLCGPFAVDVMIEDVVNLAGLQFEFGFDPNIVRAENIMLGSFLTGSARPFTALSPHIDNVKGQVVFGAYSYGPIPGPSGSGAVATVYFTPVNVGDSVLTFGTVRFRDPNSTPIAVTTEDGAAVVEAYLTRDLDNDCDVDVTDIMLVASRWGARLGDPTYDPHYDVDRDGDIDIGDIMLVAAHWGRVCSPPGGSPSPAEGKKPAAPAEGSSPDVQIKMPIKAGRAKEEFTVELTVEGAGDLGGFDLTLHFDPGLLQVQAVTPGDWMSGSDRTVQMLGPAIDNAAGTVRLGGFSYGQGAGASGDGLLATLTFRSLHAGSGKLGLSNLQLTDTRGRPEKATVTLARADTLR